MSLNSGDRILDKYQVIKRIGEGGMSNVYLCQSLAPAGSPTAGQWVLKEMTVAYRDKSDQDNAIKLFLHEAQLLQQLRHKNLPRVVDQFVVGNRYYTVMEYIEGEDLGKMLLRNPNGFAEAKVIGWGVQIATVLYYLHSQKDERGMSKPIIFRDLKPSNIMISRGEVKLIDFGIARRFDAFKKKDTMRIGSPGYAPPEQYSGQTDARSDIYALGVTLHQLLTGRDPAETQTPFKLPSIRALKPQVTTAMEEIVTTATQLDPQKRFRTALDMKRALSSLAGVQSGPLRGGTVPVGPPPPMPSAPPPPVVARPAQVVRSSDSPIPPRVGPPAIATPRPPARPLSPYAAAPPAPPSVAAAASALSAAPPPAAPPPAIAASSPAPRPGPPASESPGAEKAPVASSPTASAASTTSTKASLTAPKTLLPPTPPRTGRSNFPVILIMLAVFGYAYHQTIWSWIKPLVYHPSPSASPTVEVPTPTPTVASSPTPPVLTPVQRAFAMLDAGQVEPALDLLEDIRKSDPSNGLGLMAWCNALVLAAAPSGEAPRIGSPIVLAVWYTDDGRGREWLRGVALAQRDLNARGGVQGHLVLMMPYAVDDKTEPDAVVKAAVGKKALAALADLPQARLAAFATACGREMAIVAASPRTTGADGAVGPPASLAERVAAQFAASDLKPQRIAIVASAEWPKSTVDAELRRLLSTATTKSWLDGGEKAAEIAAMKPDLVIFLGDARALERYAAAARAVHLTAPILAVTGPTGEATADGGALLDWIRNGRLWIVTRWSPSSDSTGAGFDRFVLAYDRAFALTTAPDLVAVEGFDMVGMLEQGLEGMSTDWTAELLRAALQLGQPGLSGDSAADKSAAPWFVLRFLNSAPVVAKAVTI